MRLSVSAQEPPQPSAAGPGRWWMLLLGAMSVFGAVSIEMYLPALPVIAADLKAGPGDVELTISAFLIALAIGQLLYGPIADRVGLRQPLLIGVALYCAASVACAFATSVEQLIVFRFAQASGGCAGAVIARMILRDLYPQDRLVQALASLNLVTGLAPLLSPLIGGAVLHVASWRSIFAIQAAFGLVILLASALSIRPGRRVASAQSHSVLSAYRSALSDRQTLGFVLTHGFGSALIFIYGANLPAVATSQYGLSAQTLSVVLASGAAGMLACNQLNRLLLRSFSSEQILRFANSATLVMAAVLCAVVFWTDLGLPGLIAPLFLILCLRGLTLPHTAAAVLRSQPTRAGVASALIGASGLAFGAASSALAAAFADGTAKSLAVVVLGAALAAVISLRGVAAPA